MITTELKSPPFLLSYMVYERGMPKELDMNSKME